MIFALSMPFFLILILILSIEPWNKDTHHEDKDG